MKCPNCSEVALVMSERQGVEIDYCPQCRGVWLDRGELDKLVEKAAPTQRTGAARPDFVDSDQLGATYGNHAGRRKKAWLGEIFD